MAESNIDDIIKGRFVKRVFEDAGKEIDKAQVKYMRGHGFDNPDWYSGRSFVSSEHALEYSQMLRHRFVDMKHNTWKKKGPGERKPHPIHNKIVFGEYNSIIKELSFGYTEAVKNNMLKLDGTQI